jgi:hypothetical protein
MSIVRTRRAGSFTVIPNQIINDSRLQWQELGLLVYLLSKPETWEVRIPALAKERDLKERTLYGIFKRLREFGYAEFKKHRDGSSEWVITDDLGEKTPVDQEIMPVGKNCNLQKPQVADFAGSKKPHGKNCHAILKTEDLVKTEEEEQRLNVLADDSAMPEPEQVDPKPKRPRKPKAPKAEKAPAKGAATWDAYSVAYKTRYGIEPGRDGTINAQVAKFVDRLGSELAPEAAAFYLTMEDRFYLQCHHTVGAMLKDVEKIGNACRLWMANGKQKTPAGQATAPGSTQKHQQANYDSRTTRQQTIDRNHAFLTDLALGNLPRGNPVPPDGSQLWPPVERVDGEPGAIDGVARRVG